MTIPLFPTLRGVTKPNKRTPIMSTDMEVAFSGAEAHFPNWSYPKYRHTLKFDFLRADVAETDWQNLEGFWKIVKVSPGGLFQYQFSEDGGPNTGVTDNAMGTGDGSTRIFQTVRTLGGFVEPVFLPTFTNVKVNGTPTAAYTVDAFGRITFTTAPAAAATITWTGIWNWYCRFDKDEADFENFAYRYWQLGELVFTTQKMLGDA
jgi:hypothetical protein